jgi:hypothetical protein
MLTLEKRADSFGPQSRMGTTLQVFLRELRDE